MTSNLASGTYWFSILCKQINIYPKYITFQTPLWLFTIMILSYIHSHELLHIQTKNLALLYTLRLDGWMLIQTSIHLPDNCSESRNYIHIPDKVSYLKDWCTWDPRQDQTRNELGVEPSQINIFWLSLWFFFILILFLPDISRKTDWNAWPMSRRPFEHT